MMRTGWARKAMKDALTYGQGCYERRRRKWYNPLRYIIGPMYSRWIPLRDMMAAEPIAVPKKVDMHCALLFRPFSPETVAGMLPYLPFTYKMPCGKIFTISSILQIPENEVPCPCGNPAHWLIKHAEVDQ